MQEKIALFSRLFRELEADMGTRDMSLLVLRAFVSSVKTFHAQTASDFCKQFDELVKCVSSTEPKFGILNYNFALLSKRFAQIISCEDYEEKKWKKLAIHEVKAILDSGRGEKKALIKMSEKIDVEGKTVLIHDHSHTVHDVLAHFKSMGRKFRVVIAEQDYEKTHSNIERIHGLGVPFQVVPSYMISHVHDNIDMAFFGGVTLKDSMHFVMDPGTYGVVSELQVDDLPVYMFIDTKKFSLWKSKERGEIFIYKHTRAHHSKPIDYERVKYSHDRVPAKLFHKIVTNEGIFSPAELKKRFMEMMRG